MINFPPETTNPTEIISTSNFLNKEEFLKLSKQLKNIPYSEASVIHKDVEEFDLSSRSCKLKWVPFTEDFVWIYDKIASIIHENNSNYYRFNLQESFERIQYTEYNSVTKDHYDWHLDLGANDATSHRKISITIQLSPSNSYEGGILEINKGGITKVPKEKGLITIFPSYLLHRVTPVTKGIRRSLVLWVGGCPLK